MTESWHVLICHQRVFFDGSMCSNCLPIFNWVVRLLLLSFKNFKKHILLYVCQNLCFRNVFSPSVAYIFGFLNVL